MAKNFHSPGDVIDVVAPVGGVKSGGLYVIGAFAGIAQVDALEGQTFAFAVTGCWRVKKASGQILPHAAVWFDTEVGIVNASAPGAFPVGAAIAGAATDADEVVIRLSGVPVAAVAGG